MLVIRCSVKYRQINAYVTVYDNSHNTVERIHRSLSNQLRETIPLIRKIYKLMHASAILI